MNRRPTVKASDPPIQQAAAYGITAPNPHNTQAWRFEILSDTEMLLYVDPDRLLLVTDPPARQIHMGCGCFIETLVVGASGIGYQTTVEPFPQGTYSLEEIGKKPVARITLIHQEDRPPDPLFDAIYERQTNRKAYIGPMVTQQEIDQIHAWMGDSVGDVVFLNDMTTMKPLLDIFYEAMKIECITRHTYEESRVWMRFNEQQRADKRDGLSVPQTGMDGLLARLTELYLNNGNPKRWHSKLSIDSYMASFQKGLESSKAIMYLTTKTNTPLDWVQAGRAYARFHLAITKLGFYAHVNSQVLQEYDEMSELFDAFHAHLGIEAPARVQITARMGRAKKAYVAYRRHLADFLRP